MKQTAVEWLFDNLNISGGSEDMKVFNQAKEMEKQQSHLYAEFAIRCDRFDMKILYFEDWIKLETYNNE